MRSTATTASWRPSTAAPSQPAFFTVAYIVRAVAPGRYVHPPALVEDMYVPSASAAPRFGTVEVDAGAAVTRPGWQAPARPRRAPSGAGSPAQPSRSPASAGGAGLLLWRDARGPRAARPRGRAGPLDRRPRPRRPAAAALRDAGRALAPAGRGRATWTRASSPCSRPTRTAASSAIPASTRSRCSARPSRWSRHGEVVSGGSTLTMQVARLLEPRVERSLRAKLRQALRAVELERRLSKDEILAPLSHARALRRQPRRRARREPSLFRPRAEAAVLRGGGAPRRAAAVARGAPARPGAGDRRAGPATGCSTGPRARGVLTPAEAEAAKGERVPHGAAGLPDARRPPGRGGARGAPGRARCTGSPSTRACRRASRRWRAERVERLDPKLSVAILVVDNADAARSAPASAARTICERERAGAIDMTQRPALAGLGPEALHLRARVRERPRPSGDAARRPAVALRRLPAGEFRPRLPGHRDGPQGPADVAQRARRWSC